MPNSFTQLTLDTQTSERLQRLSSVRSQTSQSILQEAIEQYLDREEKQQQFRQDALAAWTDYQATGLHATQEEADAWLAKLEAGDDAPPPACHV